MKSGKTRLFGPVTLTCSRNNILAKRPADTKYCQTHRL